MAERRNNKKSYVAGPLDGRGCANIFLLSLSASMAHFAALFFIMIGLAGPPSFAIIVDKAWERLPSLITILLLAVLSVALSTLLFRKFIVTDAGFTRLLLILPFHIVAGVLFIIGAHFMPFRSSVVRFPEVDTFIRVIYLGAVSATGATFLPPWFFPIITYFHFAGVRRWCAGPPPPPESDAIAEVFH